MGFDGLTNAVQIPSGLQKVAPRLQQAVIEAMAVGRCHKCGERLGVS